MTTPERTAELRVLAAEHLAANPPPVLGPVQLTQADLVGMRPASILAAKADGLLNTLLGMPAKMPPRTPGMQVLASDLPHMTPAEIVRAQADGLCRDLLTGTHTP